MDKAKKTTKKKNTNRKNNKLFRIIPLLIVLILFAISLPFTTGDVKMVKVIKEPEIIEEVVVVEEETKGINIKQLQEEYQNTDIIGYLEIPGVISYPIVKTDNNTYYLNHLLNHNKNIKGVPFMDYRVDFEDRKVLIYGHSGKEQDLPFLQLHKYDEESFYKEHPTMYLYSIDNIYTYEIFSAYLEAKDYDYVNINSFRGLTWKEHIDKLKSKSNYNIPIELTDESKILILQTCSVEESNIGGKYKLVIGVLTNIEKNSYS